MRKAIDAHAHLSERPDDALGRFARMNGLRYTLVELLSIMRRCRVERGLLLSPPMRDNTPFPNDMVIKLCEASKGMLLPVVTVEPTARDVKAAIRLAEENKRVVKAFKIRLGYVKASAEAPLFITLYDYAESERVPVLFHTGDTVFSTGALTRSHPIALDGVANEREEMTIILCHFGNPWFEDAAELIYKHPNVYADTSGLITGDKPYAEKYAKWLSRKISEAIYYAGGAEKVLFGTDYPVTKHSDALALIQSLEIDERDKERILWRNAKQVFNL